MGLGLSIGLGQFGGMTPRAAGNDKTVPHRGSFCPGFVYGRAVMVRCATGRRYFSLQHKFMDNTTKKISFSSEKFMQYLSCELRGLARMFTQFSWL
jgi:hypothetical protein